MSGSLYSIRIDEYRPGLDPGPSSATAASASTARKSDRACDFCRRRKTRCDGAPGLDSKCSNCKKNQCPCTYLEASRPRGPPKAYVVALEDRVERFERLFKRLRPDTDFASILGHPIPRGSWKNDQEGEGGSHTRQPSDTSSKAGRSSSTPPIYLPSHASLFPHKVGERESGSEEEDFSSDEEFMDADWPRPRLTVRGTPQQVSASSEADSPAETGSGDSPLQDGFPSSTSLASASGSSARAGSNFEEIGSTSVRFLGKSSFFPLIKATRRYMRDTAGDDGFHEAGEGSDEVWSTAGRIGTSNIPRRRRQRFWTIAPWEEAWERKQQSAFFTTHSSSDDSTLPIFGFPPSDLTLPLLSLYFHHTNTIFPLLHAPIFYSQYRDNLHLRDAQFAGVVWALLAVASRWSDDPRVLWDGWGSETAADATHVKQPEEELEWASAGWRFFLRSLDGPSFTLTSLNPPSLFELQFCSLGAAFLRGSSIGPAGWVLNSIGLRKAMDVGAHRKKVYSSEPSVENELWKRAFWMLVLFDRIGAASLGRPACVRDEDFDLELPLEVDDEYWTPSDPSQPAFKQPEGKPAIVSGLIAMLKITQIKAHALRTIYCIDKSKVLLGLVSNDWQEQIVSQLNTALDEWVESTPEHLRWSSGIQNDIFSNQAATIYTTYYLTLILIYRPFTQTSAFIAEPSSDAPARPTKNFPFPADSICTSAAHSAIRIVDEQTRRGLSNIPNMISVAHIAAVTQLMMLHASPVSGTSGVGGMGIAGGGAGMGTGLGLGMRNTGFDVKLKERERYMQDVEKCIRCLELAQSRWIMARKFLTSIKSSLPESGSNTCFNPQPERLRKLDPDGPPERVPAQIGSVLPTVPSLPWSSRPISTRPTVSEAEQALKSHANWRWFHENEKFAQQRFGVSGDIGGATAGMQRAEPLPLRHHAVVPSARSSESPTPAIMLTQGVQPPIMSAPASMKGFATATTTTRSELQRRISAHSITPPPSGRSIIPDQPISSISRAVRASTSGHFLSVNSPQSAARDERGSAGTWSSVTGTSRQQHTHTTTMRVPSHPYATLHQSLRQMPHSNNK